MLPSQCLPSHNRCCKYSFSCGSFTTKRLNHHSAWVRWCGYPAKYDAKSIQVSETCSQTHRLLLGFAMFPSSSKHEICKVLSVSGGVSPFPCLGVSASLSTLNFGQCTNPSLPLASHSIRSLSRERSASRRSIQMLAQQNIQQMRHLHSWVRSFFCTRPGSGWVEVRFILSPCDWSVSRKGAV